MTDIRHLQRLYFHLSVSSRLYQSHHLKRSPKILIFYRFDRFSPILLDIFTLWSYFALCKSVLSPPRPQRGSDQTAASLNGVLRRSDSENILQGSENGCVLIRKKVYGVGARRDGWSRPLPLGAPRPMIFKWLILCRFRGYNKNLRNRIS